MSVHVEHHVEVDGVHHPERAEQGAGAQCEDPLDVLGVDEPSATTASVSRLIAAQLPLQMNPWLSAETSNGTSPLTGSPGRNGPSARPVSLSNCGRGPNPE
jgi:hypothetical protein